MFRYKFRIEYHLVKLIKFNIKTVYKMTCLNQYFTKNMAIYMLVACLFQVSGGRAAPDPQTISVDVPDTSYVQSIFGGLTSRAKSMASNVVSRYLDSADAAAESGKNMVSFLHRMNESAINFGTNTASRMGQMVKNGTRNWSSLLSGIFSSEQ